jgi:hypothetical protein
VAVGRRNCLFAASDRGGQRVAVFYTLIESAKINELDPEAYLRHLLTHIPEALAFRPFPARVIPSQRQGAWL